jgi:hypothetical protein
MEFAAYAPYGTFIGSTTTAKCAWATALVACSFCGVEPHQRVDTLPSYLLVKESQ